MDKGIEFGKEKRKPYRGSKAFDRTCRNHGNCPWCEGGRQHKNRKQMLKVASIEEEYLMEPDEPEDQYEDEWYEFDRVMDMAAEMEEEQ
jgi:hypothetical protein